VWCTLLYCRPRTRRGNEEDAKMRAAKTTQRVFTAARPPSLLSCPRTSVRARTHPHHANSLTRPRYHAAHLASCGSMPALSGPPARGAGVLGLQRRGRNAPSPSLRPRRAAVAAAAAEPGNGGGRLTTRGPADPASPSGRGVTGAGAQPSAAAAAAPPLAAPSSPTTTSTAARGAPPIVPPLDDGLRTVKGDLWCCVVDGCAFRPGTGESGKREGHSPTRAHAAPSRPPTHPPTTLSSIPRPLRPRRLCAPLPGGLLLHRRPPR
jgi:hypothetical protein